MATIKVNSDAIRTKANTFSTTAKQIQTIADDINTDVTNLKTYWTGSAAEEYATKFTNMLPTFDEIKKKVEEFTTFLNNTADSYEKAENSNMGAQ